jgi:2-amino-4-hydroxy-6-hydroxymethyldihydropteridine diphosphokinase
VKAMTEGMNPATAYLGLGSNMGERELLLQQAVNLLHQSPSVEVIRCSNIYETDPVGFVDQSLFLNMVIAVKTTLSPHELFAVMVKVEKNLGRTRHVRWGPRTIDVDLLMYEDVKLTTADLVIPHSRMHERGFVLIPLLEIIDRGQVEDLESAKSSLEKLDGKDGVVLWRQVNWHRESGHFAS